MEPNYHPHSRLFLILAFLLSFSVFLVSLSFYLQSRNKNLSQEQEALLQDKQGQLTIEAKNIPDSGKVRLNTPQTFTVYGSSDEEAVAGYDIVLSFDPNKIRYVSNTNLNPDFQLFVTQQAGKLYITGAKNIKSTNQTIFKYTPLVDLVFLPIKKGEATLDFSYVPNSKSDSNIITDKNEDVLIDVRGIVISVE